MDFRFKYSRHPDSPEQKLLKKQEERLEKDRSRSARGLAIGLAIPTLLATGPLGGWLLGSWLDGRFGTGYWTLIFILLGIAAGMFSTIRVLMKLNN